ncbi:ComEC/Rec2 family competence protein [Clostridium botulinum]|uniref:ComEC/Rec2 family competence protein n=1 Tax=Clostridium botulinum TaxID=1491 RepID=UPI0004D891EC|nr:ComEC/Rec2 family competence protein [Clostridium botulinum]KEI01762.1 metallo-beta-lactamase [Clostridium botulinum C/D str. BKT75002]KEI07422.1 metallo-beta-lactamase [Clostridium botulinum C/D str. BKT2873]KOC49341.1 metallo-beta-lactamase [Clostridium botulinum]QPW61061.1 MBL fold metallo-hydrolase [Clostridium botulinum]
MKKFNRGIFISLLLFVVVLFTACNASSKGNKFTQNTHQESGVNNINGDLKVHFIDVGQADSILITEGSYSMLIDAGNNDDGDMVVSYLKKVGVKKLDYVIGTHPHEDHIGGLDNVINTFEINKIYMPKKVSTTKTYKDVIKAIKNKNMKITLPKPGESFKLGKATCSIVAPKQNQDYQSANNYSIVIKLTYGSKSFLFTGDAEGISESEILSGRYDIKADVLKVGHHGSRTSTTEAFLNKIAPEFAVISCGKANDYGHPHKATMDKLKAKHIQVYRTDESGTIIATSDGKNIGFNTKLGSYNYNDNSKGKASSSVTNVPITNLKYKNKSQSIAKGNQVKEMIRTGKIKGNINSKGEKIYHIPGGVYYDKTVAEVWFNTESEAQAAGYRGSKR